MTLAATFPKHGEGERPTLGQVRDWPATVSVGQACQALGISRAWGYSLVSEDAFPVRVLTIRGRTRVLTSSLISVLEGGAP